MADTTTKLLLFGGAGLAAWWFFLRSPSAAAPVAAPAAVVPVTSAVGLHTLDAIYQRMVALAKAPAEGYGVDLWDAYLNQAEPSVTAPDPMPLFQAAIPGFDRSQPVKAADYWVVMAPALKKQYGLSGLGFYASVFGGRA